MCISLFNTVKSHLSVIVISISYHLPQLSKIRQKGILLFTVPPFHLLSNIQTQKLQTVADEVHLLRSSLFCLRVHEVKLQYEAILGSVSLSLSPLKPLKKFSCKIHTHLVQFVPLAKQSQILI